MTGHFNLVEMVQADALAQARAEARRHPGAYVAKMGDTPSNLGSGLRGSFVVLQPRDNYAVGDVVEVPGYRGGGMIHPVVATRDGEVMTKGTFNRAADGWSKLGNVKGKLVRAFREK